MNKLITIILITVNSILYAQDPFAKEILDKVSKTIKGYKNITIDFEFIFEKKSQKIKETQKGQLILESQNFILHLQEQTIINNGETQWIYLPEMNEVQIMEHDPEDNIADLYKMFTIYEEDYKYEYLATKIETALEEVTVHIIDLFPKESQEFIKINLSIDAQKCHIKKIIIHDKHGGTYTYIIKSFKPNTKIQPFTFDIKKHPGIDVIDLR